jgi:UDP-glucose 4-epimerase
MDICMPHSHKPTILVFGGTGFIGSNFANYAAGLGARVVACGNASRPRSALDAAVEVVQLDATDLDATLDLFRTVRPYAVVFGIARITPRAGKEIDPKNALTELRALANVIQGSGECGVQQLVFCSSGGAIYGDGRNPHVETDPCAPKSLYGRLKLQAESLASTLCEPLGIRAAILRIGNPYGPGQSPFGLHGVIPAFIFKMLTAAPITIFGSLEAAKDYVFVEDVSAAIWASIERPASGIFNIASGQPTTLRTLVERISAACAAKPDMQYLDLAATEVPAFTLDITKAKSGLRWKPAADMDLGIPITKRWIEQTFLPKEAAVPSRAASEAPELQR